MAIRKKDHRFIGFIGCVVAAHELPFAPATEIGWRLVADVWGQGFASEGARAVRDYAFYSLGLPELVAITTVQNAASRKVMEKIGLIRDPDGDFLHPLVPEDWAERLHVLYRLKRPF